MGKIIAHGADRAGGAGAAARRDRRDARSTGVKTNLRSMRRCSPIRNSAPGASIRASSQRLARADARTPEVRAWLTCNWSRPRCATATSACGRRSGIDTARTLSIAPVMDRVGFTAIDFTTSTHMGVAVRYKKEDPWERIRLMAAATPNTPLQFMSHRLPLHFLGDRQPRVHGAGIPRAGAQRHPPLLPRGPDERRGFELACARMVKQGGGEFVIAALVFTLSPIHDDAHYVERARAARGLPDVDALYIKDPGGLLSPKRAATLIPAIKAVIGDEAAGAALSLHHRPRRATLHGRAGAWRERLAVRFAARPPTASRIHRPSASSPICARWGIASHRR